MDAYSTRVVAGKAPFDSEPASEAAAYETDIVDDYICPWVTFSVEGFIRSKVVEDETREKLIKLFKPCGDVSKVVFPSEPLLEGRAFVTIFGDDAKEKALKLNGHDMGGWKALVKFIPEEENEELQVEDAYWESLMKELENDKRFMFGICVEGYDSSLGEDEVERSLRAHFSSCGEITHVHVDSTGEINIYFSDKGGEDKALHLDGSEVDGFKITVVLASTLIRSKVPCYAIGASIPAIISEFSEEMREKVDFYMTEWRLNAMTKKLRDLKKQRAMALKKQKVRAFREPKTIGFRLPKTIGFRPKVKALKKQKPGVLKKLKAWALRKLKARAWRERGHSPLLEKERMLM